MQKFRNITSYNVNKKFYIEFWAIITFLVLLTIMASSKIISEWLIGDGFSNDCAQVAPLDRDECLQIEKDNEREHRKLLGVESFKRRDR